MPQLPPSKELKSKNIFYKKSRIEEIEDILSSKYFIRYQFRFRDICRKCQSYGKIDNGYCQIIPGKNERSNFLSHPNSPICFDACNPLDNPLHFAEYDHPIDHDKIFKFNYEYDITDPELINLIEDGIISFFKEKKTKKQLEDMKELINPKYYEQLYDYIKPKPKKFIETQISAINESHMQLISSKKKKKKRKSKQTNSSNINESNLPKNLTLSIDSNNSDDSDDESIIPIIPVINDEPITGQSIKLKYLDKSKDNITDKNISTSSDSELSSISQSLSSQLLSCPPGLEFINNTKDDDIKSQSSYVSFNIDFHQSHLEQNQLEQNEMELKILSSKRLLIEEQIRIYDAEIILQEKINKLKKISIKK